MSHVHPRALSVFAAWLMLCGHAAALPPSLSPPFSPLGVARLGRSGIIPQTHLPKLIAAAAPKVCLTGDSTSTLTPNPLVPTDILYYNLTRRIREDFPAKTWTSTSFPDFAVGSQTWNTLNAVATANWPAFYFNTSLPWLPYIQAANCTSLFINMGVNDANGIQPSQIQQVLAKVVGWGMAPAAAARNTAYAAGTVAEDSAGKLQIVATAGTTAATAPTWATMVGTSTTDGTATWQLLSAAAYVPGIPDIVLITNKNANVLAAAPYNTAAFQNGTVAAASYERTMALSGAPGFAIAALPPMGLIDTGRVFTMLFNGFDPAAQSFTQAIAAPIGGITTFPYVLPATGGDIDVSITVSGSNFASGTTLLGLTTGCPGTGTVGCTYVYLKNSTTSTVGYVNNGTGTGSPGSVSATVANSWNTAANNTITVTAHGDHLFVTVNGLTVFDALTARYVSPFTPQVTLTGATGTPSLTVNGYNVSAPIPYSPIVTDPNACFGYAGGPNGGNGINHDASLCINAADVAALDATRFAP